MDMIKIPEVRAVQTFPQICSSMLSGPRDGQGVPVLVLGGSYGKGAEVLWTYL